MHLTIYLLLDFMFQSVYTAQMISSQQKEGIGNLIALGLLALFVVGLIVAGIRFKGRRQKTKEPEKPPQGSTKRTFRKNFNQVVISGHKSGGISGTKH